MKIGIKILGPLVVFVLVVVTGVFKSNESLVINSVISEYARQNLVSINKIIQHHCPSDVILLDSTNDTFNESFKQCVSSVQDPSIFKMDIWDKNGRVVFSTTGSDKGTKVADTERIHQTFLTGSRPSWTYHKSSKEVNFSNYLKATFPLRSTSGEMKYSLDVFVSTSGVLERVRQASNHSLFLLIILSSLLIAGVFLIVTLIIISPIKRLEYELLSVGKGDFSRPALKHSKDEIGYLAEQFEKMKQEIRLLIHNLEESKKALALEKATVEEKVVERTKELARETSRLQASVDNLTLGYIMFGKDNNIITLNKSAVNILTLSTPTTQEVNKVIDTRNVAKLINLTFLQNEFGGSINWENEIQEIQSTKASKVLKGIPYKMLFLNIYLTPILNQENGELLGTVLIIEDTTEQRILERSKDEFFSIASHELRTPLTAIRGNASLLLEYFVSKINDIQVTEIISDIHKSSLRLTNIVNDFLDLSTAEQGKVQYESSVFDVVDLCESIVKEYDVTGSRKKLFLRVNKPSPSFPLVYADKVRIRQIIVNLLGNGIKFTQEGGVEVTFEDQESSVKVFIHDTGMGIPLVNRALLFRKFQQAESNIYTRDTSRGTGLGLYISKLLMSQMGGTISLEQSEEGKGSTFSVRIPKAINRQIQDVARS